MVSVRALYDGHQLQLLEKVNIHSTQEVIIVFPYLDSNTPDDDISAIEIANMVQDSGALGFLANEQEDIYSDEDIKQLVACGL